MLSYGKTRGVKRWGFVLITVFVEKRFWIHGRLLIPFSFSNFVVYENVARTFFIDFCTMMARQQKLQAIVFSRPDK